MALEVNGPPVLIIEVLSESTYDIDLDLKRGKGYGYARAGVREYGNTWPSIPHPPFWRLGSARGVWEGVYRPREPDADGRWQSEEIAVAIGLEGTLATVCTREGERQLREGEVAEELARLRAEVERMRRLLDERQGAQE